VSEAISKASKARGLVMALLMIVIMLGLGLFAIQRLGDLHDLITEINVNHTPELLQLNDLAANSERVRNLQSLTLLTKEVGLKESVNKRMAYAQERRLEAWTAHWGSLPEEQQALIQPVTKAWDDYLELSGKALSLNESGESDAAIALFNTEAQHAMDRYRGAFRAYWDLVTQSIQKKADQGDVLYDQSCLVIMLIFLFAVPMGILAGFSVSSLWSA